MIETRSLLYLPFVYWARRGKDYEDKLNKMRGSILKSFLGQSLFSSIICFICFDLCMLCSSMRVWCVWFSDPICSILLLVCVPLYLYSCIFESSVSYESICSLLLFLPLSIVSMWVLTLLMLQAY